MFMNRLRKLNWFYLFSMKANREAEFHSFAFYLPRYSIAMFQDMDLNLTDI